MIQLKIISYNPGRDRRRKAAAMFAEIAAWRQEIAAEERAERDRREAVIRAHTVYKGGADGMTDEQFREAVRA